MMRPNTPTFSLFGGIGLPTIAWIVKGISEMCVTSCLVTTSQKRDRRELRREHDRAADAERAPRRPALRVHVEERAGR